MNHENLPMCKRLSFIHNSLYIYKKKNQHFFYLGKSGIRPNLKYDSAAVKVSNQNILTLIDLLMLSSYETPSEDLLHYNNNLRGKYLIKHG